MTCVRWIPLDDPRNTVENLGHKSYVKLGVKGTFDSATTNVYL